MRVDTFDYELPPERIAQRPVEPRDSSRLLVLKRSDRSIEHRTFRDLPEFLSPPDILVVNDTRVVPARLYGTRLQTGGRWEGLFLTETPQGWELMTQTRGKPLPGEIIAVDGADWTLELVKRTTNNTWIARPSATGRAWSLLEAAGHIPLPPYIRKGQDEPADRERYQTIYADRPGAVAAPTAGLHFTKELLTTLRQKGIDQQRVTLHVGAGTFLPVTADETSQHVMHEEWCELSPDVARSLASARAQGGRVVAVGTTVVRTLESAAACSSEDYPRDGFSGSTNLFIVPGYQYRAVDALITNFHLPKSTLLMLVAAFADTEFVLDAYREAVRQEYRFYSYGDAMLIL
jgi:S-adenosylmethionine:tRNA ribosyltransferase-isomerase